MMEIVEFLTARLDEEEQIAQATVHPGYEGVWEFSEYEEDGQNRWDLDFDRIAPMLSDTSGMGPSTMRHIARHDPARVLADVAAKRLIIEAADDATGLDMQVDSEWGTSRRDEVADPYVGDVILRALALPYADHPDYDEAWRP